jgi:hypothetical protein
LPDRCIIRCIGTSDGDLEVTAAGRSVPMSVRLRDPPAAAGERVYCVPLEDRLTELASCNPTAAVPSGSCLPRRKACRLANRL